MFFDLQNIARNVQRATTEDLLNRVTAYRAGMEPEAVRIIDAELRRRDVTPEQIAAHAERVREESLFLADGTAAKCSFCHNPAVGERRGWHKLFGGPIPLYPRSYRYCREHLPKEKGERGASAP
jgi:hypothetical protein